MQGKAELMEQPEDDHPARMGERGDERKLRGFT
jgi:hypothetical protein